MKRLILLFIVLASLSSLSFSKIIYTPCDSLRTIQDGINVCFPGDTLIIYPGTYHEHLRVFQIAWDDDNPAGITIGSEFLLSGDRSKISETVIDASGEGTCVFVDRTYNTKHRMVGLTLQNGMSTFKITPSAAAGGAVIDEARLYLSDMRIQGHKSEWLASAIYCMSGSRAYIENSIITENKGTAISTALGGSVILTNVVISKTEGASIGLSESSGIEMINSTLADNSAGIHYLNKNRIIILNSILWNKSDRQVDFSGDEGNLMTSEIFISNSCIKGGYESVYAPRQYFIKMLRNTISEEPQFFEPSQNDYSLEPFSPCINEGADSLWMDDKMIRAPKYDFFGNDRPSPPLSKIDLGAIENGLSTFVSQKETPSNFQLLQNYPNPFNPTTTISFDLPQDGFVVLKIYDVTGRLVRVLVQEQKLSGAHSILWDGLNDAGQKVAAGVYLYRVEFVDRVGKKLVMTRKMSLVK